jgi:hypothetical protein
LAEALLEETSQLLIPACYLFIMVTALGNFTDLVGAFGCGYPIKQPVLIGNSPGPKAFKVMFKSFGFAQAFKGCPADNL